MQKNKSKAPGVEWAPGHFSWALVDYKDINVKLEEVPPEGKSEIHFHRKSLQFFFILEGEAFFKLDDRSFALKKHEGIEIPIREKHQILNSGKKKLLFLLISSPKVRDNDIFNVEAP